NQASALGSVAYRRYSDCGVDWRRSFSSVGQPKMRATSQDYVVREPMSEKLGRLPSVGFWIVITLLVAVLVICLFGSIIGLMVQPQSPNLTMALMYLNTVLMSEFFWGLIVGLLLSVIGAYCLAVFTARQQRKADNDLIKNFCIDTVDNIKAIVDDMVD